MKKKLTESEITTITSAMLGTEEVQETIWATYDADSEIDDEAIESILDRLYKAIKTELRKSLPCGRLVEDSHDQMFVCTKRDGHSGKCNKGRLA